jgi:hypothetical protein
MISESPTVGRFNLAIDEIDNLYVIYKCGGK